MKKLNKNDILFKSKSNSENWFVITKNNPSTNRFQQDEFHMYVTDGFLNVVKDWGSHPSLEGAKKFARNKGLISENKDMKFKNKLYLLENELSYSKEERKAFLESLKRFSTFKNEVYRSKTLREISQQLGELVESAEGFTLQETQDNFDKISVSRDLKEIKNDYNLFAKTCNEITTLQQRLEAVYENIGNKLGRYYDI